MTARRLVLAAALAAALAACNQQPAAYIDVTGGGFIFNYRLAIAFAGIVVVPRAALPDKSRLEVTMENPAGGPAVAMRQAPGAGGRIEFNTEPLAGIVADRPYAVTVRLLAENGTELQRIDKTFKSQLDQSALPPAALTIGPGYTPNPALPAQ